MCFSAGGIENFLIWLVVVCAVIGVLRILVPWILSLAGIGVDGQIMRIINIIIVAFVIVALIIFAFGVFQCLGGGVPRLR